MHPSCCQQTMGTNHRLPKSFYCADLCRPSYAHFNAFYNLFQLCLVFVLFLSFLIATTFGQQQHLNHKFFQSINMFDDDWTFVHRSSFCVSFLSISMNLLLFWLRCYCLSWWIYMLWLTLIGEPATFFLFIFSQIILSIIIFSCLRFVFFFKNHRHRIVSHQPSAFGFRSQWINMRSSKIFWFIIEIWIVLFVIFISIFIRMTAMIPFPSLCFLFGAFSPSTRWSGRIIICFIPSGYIVVFFRFLFSVADFSNWIAQQRPPIVEQSAWQKTAFNRIVMWILKAKKNQTVVAFEKPGA